MPRVRIKTGFHSHPISADEVEDLPEGVEVTGQGNDLRARYPRGSEIVVTQKVYLDFKDKFEFLTDEEPPELVEAEGEAGEVASVVTPRPTRKAKPKAKAPVDDDDGESETS